MDVTRTPDERFAGLPDYAFAPQCTTLASGLRMHHVDQGPAEADPIRSSCFTASRPGAISTGT